MAEEESDDGRNLAFVVVAVVVGGIVLVGVTVVVAAAIGSSVLGMGGSTGQTAPEISFGVTTTEEATTVTHESGDSVDATRLTVAVNGQVRGSWNKLSADGDGTAEAGDLIRVPNASPGDTLTIRWAGESDSELLLEVQV